MESGEYGPFELVVRYAGFAVAAGHALVGLVLGKGVSAPSPFATRVSGLLSGIALAILYVQSQAILDAPRFGWIATGCLVLGAIGAVIYYRDREKYCFTCPDDPQIYVDGQRLKAPAQSVLDGQLTGLPPQYANIPPPPPADSREFFCDSGKDPNFIWERDGIVRAQTWLLITYGLFIMPLAIALACVGIALTQLPVKETPEQAVVVLPADVLFAFGKSDLKPDAKVALARLAEELRTRKVSQLRIEGHTDSLGRDDVNQKLSEDRAKAVAQFLAQSGGLGSVRMTTIGFGATKPIADNTKPGGGDDPAGRAKNRRVTVVAEK
jgi:outer membrane protein OmpA-like peptidoglycan-associated protein